MQNFVAIGLFGARDVKGGSNWPPSQLKLGVNQLLQLTYMNIPNEIALRSLQQTYQGNITLHLPSTIQHACFLLVCRCGHIPSLACQWERWWYAYPKHPAVWRAGSRLHESLASCPSQQQCQWALPTRGSWPHCQDLGFCIRGRSQGGCPEQIVWYVVSPLASKFHF